MDIEFYKMRIDAIGEAAKRSRWDYVVATVASLAQIGATFNASFSWIGQYARACKQFSGTDSVVEELQKYLLKTWVESISIEIPLIEIRFSAFDASLIGSIALTILAVWLFYCYRRENYAIWHTIRCASQESQEMKCFVYYGIWGTQLFSTLSANDEPYSSLEAIPSKVVPGIRLLVRALMFLPALAIGFVIFSDLLSIFWQYADFRTDHRPLVYTITDTGTRIEIVVLLATAVVLCAYTIYLLHRVNKYQSGTVSLLQELNSLGWGESCPTSLKT